MSNPLNELAEKAHANATKKGFHPEGETVDHFIEHACNNMHGEVSELYNAWRDGELDAMCDKADKMIALGIDPLTCKEEELADIIIRALDNAKHLGVDIDRAVRLKMQFNAERPYLHGGKKS